MTATSVASRSSRLDVLLDGVRITRSASAAARRGTEQVREVSWDDVEGATVERTAKGRAVVRLAVRGVEPVADRREDPYAVKADVFEDAVSVVALIGEEVATRRRWRELSGGKDPGREDLVSPA